MSKATKIVKETTKGKGEPAKVNGHDSNPYRAGGSYFAVVESCRKLGIGKMHSFAALLKVFPSAMGAENWKAFKSKEARNENGKDADAKVLQNFTVVNRNDYGLPLRRCGFEVRKEKTANGYTFGLFKLGTADIKAAQSFKIVRHPKTAPVVKATTKGKGAKATPVVKVDAKAKAFPKLKLPEAKAAKGKSKTTARKVAK